MTWLLLLLACPKPTVDPLFPIPGLPAPKRVRDMPKPKPDDPCVAACIERNMARAVVWSQVVEDCKTSCTLKKKREDEASEPDAPAPGG